MKATGYGVLTGPGGVTEYDTITCGHCGSVRPVKSSDPTAPLDPGGFCRICTNDICGACVDIGVCTPFMRRIEEQEERARFLDGLSG